MGLLKAGVGALSGVFADQWREFFYCEALDQNTLVTKGEKKVGGRSSNTKGTDNVISNGSIIAINDGQCAIIVESGKVVELCAEAGEFVYDNSTEPSLLYGGLGENIKNTFSQIGKRFTFGGDVGKDQRVYYFNTKEIMGNKYGTPTPVPFRVVDNNIGLDIDIAIRCHGEYSYKITNPLLFYTNVCGNVESSYNKENIDSKLKGEFLTALQPAFAEISATGIRYSELPGHTMKLAQALNNVLSEQWRDLRGIEVVAVGVSSVSASEEDEKMIKELQRNAAFRNPNMAAAHLVGAQAQAMQDAAKNEGGMGAMGAFMGMNMAQGAGGTNAAALFGLGQQQAQQPAQAAPQGASAGGWTCECGSTNQGKFCANCGKPQPAPSADWTCNCGTVNKGNFCANCGTKKPEAVKKIKCDKCGWEAQDGVAPKFCPNCGDPVDSNDIG